MDLTAEKRHLRKRLRLCRDQLSLELRRQYSLQIVSQLREMSCWRQAGVVLAYMNFGSEFEAELLVKAALDESKCLILPKVNPITRQLELFQVHDLATQLAPGSWGIFEPVTAYCTQLTALNEVELALLPGLGFTRLGHRLGYGGGFYDRLLASFVELPPLLAPTFSLQLVEKLPLEPTDINVDWIVTEQEIIACSDRNCVLKERN